MIYLMCFVFMNGKYMDRLSHLLCRIVRQGNLEMMPLLLDVGIDITGKRKEEVCSAFAPCISFLFMLL